jgi:NDP-sugar pyrophosphorylase family protein
MKGVILAAGISSRLKSISQNMPKPLFEINGEIIIEKHIRNLKYIGISEIYINTHFFSDLIIKTLGNGEKFNVNIKYFFEKKLLGTSGALNSFRNYLNEDFMVIYGDNYSTLSLEELIKFYKNDNYICVIGLHRREDVSQCGVVFLNENNEIIRFIEKPGKDNIGSNLVNAGIYICNPDILKYIPDNRNSDFAKDVFPKIIHDKIPLYGIELPGKLIPIDTPKLLTNALNRKI